MARFVLAAAFLLVLAFSGMSRPRADLVFINGAEPEISDSPSGEEYNPVMDGTGEKKLTSSNILFITDLIILLICHQIQQTVKVYSKKPALLLLDSCFWQP